MRTYRKMAKDVVLVSTWTANFMKKKKRKKRKEKKEKKKKPEQPIRAHRKGNGYKDTTKEMRTY